MLRRLLTWCTGAVFLAVLLVQGGWATPSPIQAVIRYSEAPWDGAAYEILIPLEPDKSAVRPFVRIDIWGNPEYEQSRTIHLTPANGSDSHGPGRASYQPVLNQSLPASLYGSITFDSLRQGQPVSGSFDLAAADGRVFKGTFAAPWGNQP